MSWVRPSAVEIKRIEGELVAQFDELISKDGFVRVNRQAYVRYYDEDFIAVFDLDFKKKYGLSLTPRIDFQHKKVGPLLYELSEINRVLKRRFKKYEMEAFWGIGEHLGYLMPEHCWLHIEMESDAHLHKVPNIYRLFSNYVVPWLAMNANMPAYEKLIRDGAKVNGYRQLTFQKMLAVYSMLNGDKNEPFTIANSLVEEFASDHTLIGDSVRKFAANLLAYLAEL